jgi:VanZ family protein
MANGESRITLPIFITNFRSILAEVRRALLWGPPLFWMALIFYLSSQSDPAPAVTSLIWDKFLHSGAYAVLAVLFGQALVGEGVPPVRACIGAVILASLYGGSDEIHQMFTPFRHADVRDWFADTVGAATGIVLARLVFPFSRLLHPQRPLPR